MASQRRKEKAATRHISNLTKIIEMMKDKVVVFKDVAELQVDAQMRLTKYYREFEELNI